MFLIAAQVTALVAYACAIGVEAVSEGYQSGMWSSSKFFFWWLMERMEWKV